MTMKIRARIFLMVMAMAIAYLAGSMVATGRAEAVSTSPAAIPPAQWAAVEASNSLLLSEEYSAMYLPLQRR